MQTGRSLQRAPTPYQQQDLPAVESSHDMQLALEQLAQLDCMHPASATWEVLETGWETSQRYRLQAAGQSLSGFLVRDMAYRWQPARAVAQQDS